jgi:hypothetical protein
MRIRTYQAGDDAVQVAIYNEVGADLPRFKLATLDEVRRRDRDPACDPSGRLIAEEEGRPVAYVSFQTNGRVSYPWCRKGHEAVAEPLFARALAAMKERGLRRAFAAYRGDWTGVLDFFRRQGFEQTREMVNFVLDFVEMPTPSARTRSDITPLTPEDVPAVLELSEGVLGTRTADELERHLFHNPYFGPESLFALRQGSGRPVAVGLLVDGNYADPRQVDAAMPCFRLGAFGSENQTAKRIKGLFSFLTAAGPDVSLRGLDLLGHAAARLRETDLETFAAQAPSDAVHLAGFYGRYFRRQGSFPVLERTL